MPYLILIVVLLALLFGPQLWVQYVLRKYSQPQDHIPGNGAELARHLIQRFDISGVEVEQAGHEGDHYDPTQKKVRLSPDNYQQNSLTAIAVAAHEVGHALQHHRNEPLLNLRTRLSQWAMNAQKISGGLLVVIPIVTALTRAPSAAMLMFLVALGSMFLGTLIQLITLPVEIDASFGKALPILKEGNYISTEDEKAVTKILKAAAFTYVAGSLSSLLNLWRWLSVLRK
ncbi:MAG: zinc metallopeptidase [Gammaproteobacteria bacterium]